MIIPIPRFDPKSKTNSACDGTPPPWVTFDLQHSTRQTGVDTMPAKSKAQQKAAGAALAAKRGDMPKSRLQGASRSMAKSMTEKELEAMASTKRKTLPEKKDS
ncbi:hypothetical protein QE369_002490 [Agrobacterium larrymoorei]|uniref:DUF3008 family protein n=2 Tax=Agrobacterium larrymoorei TaxID=160699 RepID=A0AAJ2ET92_9HYPH|nr:hypothetical protein [Agrobacterium larrymoorei]